LRVESGVLDQRIDEDPHMVFDLMRLNWGCLVLLLDLLHQSGRDLGCNSFHVGTSLDCRNGIGKRDLLHLTVRQGKANLPSAVFRSLVDDHWLHHGTTSSLFLLFLSGSRQVHVNVLLETLDFDSLVVKEDLAILDCSSHIVYPLHQESLCVVIDLVHAESRQIWFEGDSSVFLALLVLGDLHTIESYVNWDQRPYRFGRDKPLARPSCSCCPRTPVCTFSAYSCPRFRRLLQRSNFSVGGRKNMNRMQLTELGRVDVRQFCTVTVSSTGHLFLVVVIVGRRQT
jgi:hypothetical protein